MERIGLIEPSTQSNLNINFRISDNDHHTIKKLLNIQKSNIFKTQYTLNQHNNNIEKEIFTENRAPYIILNTNLCERPLKFLIDTGAAISLVAKNSIGENNNLIKYEINVFGIMGKEMSVKTEGMIHGIFEINGQFLSTMLHVIDSKFAGPADGYLGYDFLCPYKITIDMNKMCLKINLKNLTSQQEAKNKTMVTDNPNKIHDNFKINTTLTNTQKVTDNPSKIQENSNVTDDQNKIHVNIKVTDNHIKVHDDSSTKNKIKVTDDHNKIHEKSNSTFNTNAHNKISKDKKEYKHYKINNTGRRNIENNATRGSNSHDYGRVTDNHKIQATDSYKIQEVTEDLKAHENISTNKIRVTDDQKDPCSIGYGRPEDPENN